MIINLPYPPAHCWPNSRSRSHWPKTNSVKKARGWAFAETLAMGIRHGSLNGPWPLPIGFTVMPKTRGPCPDRDNCTAAAKAYLDGICEALGINDRHVALCAAVISETRVPGGAFVFDVGGAA